MRKNDNADSDASLPEGDGEQDFLTRWSRRKAKARAARKEQAAEAIPAQQVSAAEKDPGARPATDADLPPIDTLDENSDYSAFMSPEVSEHLRRMALRKLFHTPAFNVIDPVDQFTLDWNGFTPLGSIVTHDMQAAMEREAAKLAEKAREGLLDPQGADPRVDPVVSESDKVETAVAPNGAAALSRAESASEAPVRASQPTKAAKKI